MILFMHDSDTRKKNKSLNNYCENVKDNRKEYKGNCGD